ncbi:MAG: CDP-diacylglycerol--glycerol-3-phosphate 3-phosphatidyltransferase [Oscillospiraceae bacterium]|nr:CDP-diacylglycerol--glycerol-3-phosphate 3-phosphatidyltransferase [Oscillospiraceae bacterium]
MNLPNKLTTLRVVAIPVFLIVLYVNFAYARYVAVAIFILASITDYLDGHIARKRGLVTDFGKFMDPLADKALVTAAMLMLVAWGDMPAWVLAVVLIREFAVSGMRMIAAADGKVIAAAFSGKVKTASTMVCIVIMLFDFSPVLNTVCWVVILVTTVYSGIEYFAKNRDVVDLGDM